MNNVEQAVMRWKDAEEAALAAFATYVAVAGPDLRDKHLRDGTMTPERTRLHEAIQRRAATTKELSDIAETLKAYENARASFR